jgi:malate dehydrogenase
MMQTAALLGFDTASQDAPMITEKPPIVMWLWLPPVAAQTRDDKEELIGVNAGIVKSVTENILKYSPNTIIIVISNPMDTMTYLAMSTTKLPKNRIIGMGGALDSARFRYQLSQHLGCSPADLNAVVVGGHGDTTMIPLIRLATWNSIPVTNFLNEEQQKKIVADTMVGGATLTKLIGTSAWYAPGAAGAALVESIVRDEKKLFTCCVALDGEYGQKDICLGVPVIIGKNGWEKIIDFKLNSSEQAEFDKSGVAVRGMNDVLKTL